MSCDTRVGRQASAPHDIVRAVCDAMDAGRAGVLATEAVETQDTCSVLATEAAEIQDEGSVRSQQFMMSLRPRF